MSLIDKDLFRLHMCHFNDVMKKQSNEHISIINIEKCTQPIIRFTVLCVCLSVSWVL